MFSISIDTLLKLIGKVNIIDIRSIEKYNDNHIPNAVNISANELITNSNKYLNRMNEYYIYCQRGKSSIRVCQILRRLGFKAFNINGGYEEWILRK